MVVSHVKPPGLDFTRYFVIGLVPSLAGAAHETSTEALPARAFTAVGAPGEPGSPRSLPSDSGGSQSSDTVGLAETVGATDEPGVPVPVGGTVAEELGDTVGLRLSLGEAEALVVGESLGLGVADAGRGVTATDGPTVGSASGIVSATAGRLPAVPPLGAGAGDGPPGDSVGAELGAVLGTADGAVDAPSDPGVALAELLGRSEGQAGAGVVRFPMVCAATAVTSTEPRIARVDSATMVVREALRRPEARLTSEGDDIAHSPVWSVTSLADTWVKILHVGNCTRLIHGSGPAARGGFGPFMSEMVTMRRLSDGFHGPAECTAAPRRSRPP